MYFFLDSLTFQKRELVQCKKSASIIFFKQLRSINSQDCLQSIREP